MLNPLISVIIPAYNGEVFIREAIESVLAQSYQNRELIVIDDGSTDGTQQVVRGYESCVRYMYQSNQDVAAARNHGVREAKGEWIAFLDQDDFFFPDKLALQVAALQKHSSVGIVHGGWQIVDAQRNRLSNVEPWHGVPYLNQEDWLLWKPVFLGAMLLSRNWIERVGGFNEQYHQASDVDLVLRLALMGCKSVWVPQVIVEYRQHKRNVSRNVQTQVLECEEILDGLFAGANLPDRIRVIERDARYNNAVWSAWRLFKHEELDSMTDYLQVALQYTPYPRTETILNWVELFRQYSLEYGDQLNIAQLSKSVGWQELVTH